MESEIAIRLARVHERRALEALQLRASLMWEEDRAVLLANPDAIELPLEQIEGGRVWVAERAGQVLGFHAVLPRDDGDAELDGLFVEPDAWRQGIGRLLVDDAERLASADGANNLHVIANPRALDFYRACGFVETGRQQMRFGIGICMKKHLAPQR